MRTHTKTFHIRFTEKEYQKLCQRAKQTGLSKSTYIRFMIQGCSPKERPDERFFDFMQQLRSLCNNANQIAQKAHSLGYIDAAFYQQQAELWSNMRMEIMMQLLQPEKVDVPAVLEIGKRIAEQEEKNKETSADAVPK